MFMSAQWNLVILFVYGVTINNAVTFVIVGLNQTEVDNERKISIPIA